MKMIDFSFFWENHRDRRLTSKYDCMPMAIIMTQPRLDAHLCKDQLLWNARYY